MENLSENVTALKAMKIPNVADFILFVLAIRKLDRNSRKQFEMEYHELEFPLIDDLMKFGQKHINILRSLGSRSSASSNLRLAQTKRSLTSPRTSLLAAGENIKLFACPLCTEQHRLYLCKKFISMSVDERRDYVKSLSICFNCLGGKHKASACRSRMSCRNCAKGHHTLLCTAKVSQTNSRITSHAASTASNDRTGREECNTNDMSEVTSHSSESNVPNELACPTSHIISQNSIILLGTAIVAVKAASGMFNNVRVLIDPGSQASFITTACQQRLGLPRKQSMVACKGLAENPVTTTKGITSLVIRPRQGGEELVTNAIVIKKITSRQPSALMPDGVRDSFRYLILADPDFHKPGDIDILLGAELYSQIMADGPSIRYEGNPTAWPSIFGYILIGPVKSASNSLNTCANISSCIVTNEERDLGSLLEHFWKIEEIPSDSFASQENDKAESQFKSLHYREENGRYVVPILFKEEFHDGSLGHSQTQALKRYSNLERKLAHDAHLQTEYNKTLREYLTMGHMTSCLWGSGKYLIPHHAVIKESSSTTKVRVVFDASARTSSECSLNDLLLKGPKLHKDIADLILRFRLHAIAFVADISKMYRRILIRPEHRAYQHIVWRPSEHSTLREYELNTVTFGLTSSPYLAMRVLKQLSQDEAERFPLAALILPNDVFVDDLISGSSTSIKAIELIAQLNGLLNRGGFELHKCATYSDDVLRAISPELLQTKVEFSNEEGSNFKILGLCWDPKFDLFSYNVRISSKPPSKRGVLSNLAQLFDPLGWISPVVFWAKHFMQSLWKLNIGWDDDLPSEVIDAWRLFVSQLSLLENVKIPRGALGYEVNDTKNHQLLGFCDASERGYCAVVYLRCGGLQTKGKVHLMMAKTKVAPIKTLTIPRLELMGAVLLTKLMEFVFASLSQKINIESVYAWTDSTTVLAWINTPPQLLKAFVANRIAQISESQVHTVWNHVAGKNNPADSGSRGLLPQKIINNDLWWNAPSWVANSIDQWEVSVLTGRKEELPEMKSVRTNAAVTDKDTIDITFLERYSSLIKLNRVIAYCLRFIAFTKGSSNLSKESNLSAKEISNALKICIKITQLAYFKQDFENLKGGRICSRKLQTLSPFIDAEGCLRVGGRLINSDLSYNRKHPLLLPKEAFLTT